MRSWISTLFPMLILSSSSLANAATLESHVEKFSVDFKESADAANLEPSSKPDAAAKPKNPALVQVADTPGLPRVLIIGDSISMGYTLPVRAKLKGVANLHRPCRKLRRHQARPGPIGSMARQGPLGCHSFQLRSARLEVPKCQRRVREPSQGTQVASPQVYREQLLQIIVKLKATGAKLIFASTTPVPEGTKGRRKGDEEIYNQVAIELMKEQGTPVNDLCEQVVTRQHQEAKERQPKPIQQAANVHFTAAGSDLLAEQVFASIKKALP